MKKFKITREIQTRNGLPENDLIIIEQKYKNEVIFSEFIFKAEFNTKDLGDLIEALQDKQKEIIK